MIAATVLSIVYTVQGLTIAPTVTATIAPCIHRINLHHPVPPDIVSCLSLDQHLVTGAHAVTVRVHHAYLSIWSRIGVSVVTRSESNWYQMTLAVYKIHYIGSS